jgi:hypothetical protein
LIVSESGVGYRLDQGDAGATPDLRGISSDTSCSA